jgi:hypothetical protein
MFSLPVDHRLPAAERSHQATTGPGHKVSDATEHDKHSAGRYTRLCHLYQQHDLVGIKQCWTSCNAAAACGCAVLLICCCPCLPNACLVLCTNLQMPRHHGRHGPAVPRPSSALTRPSMCGSARPASSRPQPTVAAAAGAAARRAALLVALLPARPGLAAAAGALQGHLLRPCGGHQVATASAVLA